jgi:hypothetical protein
MGQPEDYIIEDEKTQTINKPTITDTTGRKSIVSR